MFWNLLLTISCPKTWSVCHPQLWAPSPTLLYVPSFSCLSSPCFCVVSNSFSSFCTDNVGKMCLLQNNILFNIASCHNICVFWDWLFQIQLCFRAAAMCRMQLALDSHQAWHYIVWVFPNLDTSFAARNSTAMALLTGCWWGQGSGVRASVDVSSPVTWVLSVWVAGLYQRRLDVSKVVRVTPIPPSVWAHHSDRLPLLQYSILSDALIFANLLGVK